MVRMRQKALYKDDISVDEDEKTIETVKRKDILNIRKYVKDGGNDGRYRK